SMTYYAVVRVTLIDDSWVEEYLPAVTALVHKHGGNYLARTMTMERLEGETELPSVFVIIEWPYYGNRGTEAGRPQLCG
ncbi:MAG: DUF1330 domain-containing protein, partial [Hyphomicrobiales bacterium]